MPFKVSPSVPKIPLDSETVSFSPLMTLEVVSCTFSTVFSPVNPFTVSWRKSFVPLAPSLSVFPTDVPMESSGCSK